MKYAIIEDSTVINIVLSDEALSDNWRAIDSNDSVDIGYRYDNDAFIPVEKDNSIEIRAERDKKLAACDWTQLADSPLTDEQKTAWGTYRQALRDVPAQDGFPWEITWPSEPE